MTERQDTIIVGAGQAGLAAGYLLSKQNREHLILEKQRIGESWRSGKWDSFTLVTPNYMLQLPGYAYDGDQPFGFLGRDEVVQYLERYVDSFDPHVQTEVDVTAVEPAEKGIRLQTSAGPFEANNVIIATGTFQQPKIPDLTTKIPNETRQLHSSAYRSHDRLPKGAVLVVGSAQSGCQIANELRDHGRTVYLATGKANRLPRTYRGHDSFWWAEQLGILDQTVDDLPARAARFMPNPQVAGSAGDQTLSLHSLAAKGVTLLGRATRADGTRIGIGDDLMDHVAQADDFAANFKQGVDAFVEKTGMEAPEDGRPEPRNAYDSEIITELDIADAGISTIIWATGYRYDYSWIIFPVFDDVGYPITDRGVTDQPGLYFVGQHFLHKRKSGLILGVGDDAEHVVGHIAG